MFRFKINTVNKTTTRKHSFNTSYVSVQVDLKELHDYFCVFQYILCFGSSYVCDDYNYQYLLFQYILCFGSSLLKYVRKNLNANKFQYILCFGSRIFIFYKNYCVQSFNTSYVSVQVLVISMRRLWLFGFNTSYVSVQVEFGCFLWGHYNLVSIHPMFRFKKNRN